MKKIFTKKLLKEYAYITLGVFLVALAFSFFLDPYDLVIGGVSGIAIILKPYMDTSLVMLIINAGLLVLALVLLGKEFVIKTAYGSIMFPAMTYPLNLLYSALVELNHGELLINKSEMLLITLFGAPFTDLR